MITRLFLSLWLIIWSIGISLISVVTLMDSSAGLFLIIFGAACFFMIRHMAKQYALFEFEIADAPADLTVDLDAMQAQWGGGVNAKMVLLWSAVFVAVLGGILLAGAWYVPLTTLSVPALFMALLLSAVWLGALWPWVSTLKAIAHAASRVAVESTFDRTTITVEHPLRAPRQHTFHAANLDVHVDELRLTFSDGQQNIPVLCARSPQRGQMLKHLRTIRSQAQSDPFADVEVPSTLKSLLSTAESS